MDDFDKARHKLVNERYRNDRIVEWLDVPMAVFGLASAAIFVAIIAGCFIYVAWNGVLAFGWPNITHATFPQCAIVGLLLWIIVKIFSRGYTRW